MAVAQIVDALDQETDVGFRNGPWKPVGNPPAMKTPDLLRLIHRVHVEQTQGRHIDIGRARRTPRVDPAEHPGVNLLGRQALGRAIIMPRQHADAMQIVVLCVRRQTLHVHRRDHLTAGRSPAARPCLRHQELPG